MGTLGFEPRSAGFFHEAIVLQQINHDIIIATEFLQLIAPKLEPAILARLYYVPIEYYIDIESYL